MIMVTHNPDLECYANRILYIKNGMVDKQVINQYQCKYYPEEYQEKVNSKKLLFFFCSKNGTRGISDKSELLGLWKS